MSSNLLVKPTSEDTAIDNDHQHLNYEMFDDEEGAVFTLKKKIYMNFYKMSFDLRYYDSYQGFEGSRSGASVFRPNSSESKRYSHLYKVNVHKHPLVSQINLIYKDGSLVKVRMTYDSPLIEWDVKLSPIDVRDKQGKEVTVNYKAMDFDNSEIFYTD